jgi:hypothetical protein
MRFVLGIGLVLLMLSGCTYKSGPVDVSSYTPQKRAITEGPSLQKIYLKAVVDNRTQRSIVASITNAQGQEIGYATLGEPVELWIFQGLRAGLEAMGYAVVQTPVKEAKTVIVHINELMANFDGTVLTRENLQGTMSLEVTFKKGNKTITKRISQSQKTWHKPLYSPAAFRPFLQTLMDDVMARAVQEISAF